MGLFILSFFLVFTSSYLITSVLAPKKSSVGFNYLLITAFAKIILTFEILSLFSAIKEFWVLGFNLAFLFGSAFIWNKKGRPLWSLDTKSFTRRILNSFKLDKTLAVIFIGFFIFLLASIILCIFIPTSSMDALAYHVARSLFWVINGNLNQIDVADIRNICLPINSEILYSWVLLFIKKDVFLGFFSFAGYLLSIFSVYNILGLIGFSTRKKLWTIFMLSSFASVIVQTSGTETDIIVSGLLTSSILLFWHHLKKEEKTPLFMSALAYAIAIGTKTTAIIAIPAVGLFLTALSISYKKKDFYKPLLIFIGFGIINFFVFSSYNYILNYINFKNIFGSESLMQANTNYYGIKAIPANLIRYFFLFIDFTGFRWSDYIGQDILNFRSAALNFFHLGQIKEGLYSMTAIPNRTLIEPLMGAGVLGFLVFLPCLLWSFIKPVFKRKSKRILIIFGFGVLFLINMLVMSYLLAFMVFSARFVMTFMVLSAPVLTYSYLKNKNPLKYIIIAFSLFYMICVTTHLWPRPLVKITKLMIKKPSISELRNRTKCMTFEEQTDYKDSICVLRDKIEKHYSTKNKILGFFSSADNIFLIKELYFKGYDIDFATLEDAEKIDFSKYNIIIMPNVGQVATYIKDYKNRKGELQITEKGLVLKKKRPVVCIYHPNTTLPKRKDGQELYPYKVLCGVTKEFLDKRNLAPFAAAGVIFEQSDSPYFYIIYRNKNIPIYWKETVKQAK